VTASVCSLQHIVETILET